MHKVLFICFLSLSSLILHAQYFTNPALNNLVKAELGFVDDAKKYGTKKAFYKNLADSAVTFGKTIRKGRENFKGEGDTAAWLNWKPVFSDIASSGDFGYNTGPWEFWNNRADEKPVAFGEFVSVWQIQLDRKWKVEIDIGIQHNFTLRDEVIVTSTVPVKKIKKSPKSSDELFQIEKKFIESLNYSEALSNEVRFYREHKLPFNTLKELEQVGNLSYSFIDGMVASSNDLGFVYGTAVQLENDKTTYFYYLRIWKKEDGKNWKIVLDLLSKQ